MSITEVFNMPLLCGPKYVGWAFQREFNKDTQVPFYWGDNVKIIFADVQDSGQMEECYDWSHNSEDHLLIKERSTCCKPSPEPRTRYIPVLFWLEAKYWGSGCITCWQRTGQRLTNICRIKVILFANLWWILWEYKIWVTFIKTGGESLFYIWRQNMEAGEVAGFAHVSLSPW